jgi:C1A family cysteine protease
MKAVIALLIVAVVAVSAYSEFEYQDKFTAWVAENDKQYTHEEFFARYNTFKANLDWIEANNKLNKSYTVAVNKFADMTTEQFRAFMGLKPQLRASASFPAPYKSGPPADIDWTTKGAVTPVKDQGQCGSCWAFSATGAMEGAIQIKAGGNVPNLAEQQLVDCAGSSGNQGCNGGLMTYAFEYVIKAGGIANQKDYPYTARDGRCNTAVAKPNKISGSKSLTDDEDDISANIANQPVSVAIEADQTVFQFYHSGILDDSSCGTDLDHGVLAVGYGSEGGVPYWRIKNSWGATWGDKGYVRLVYGKNQCGIANELNAVPVA